MGESIASDPGRLPAREWSALLPDRDWAAVPVETRSAIEQASEPFRMAPDEWPAGSLLLDVRREVAFRKSPALIRGARRCPPSDIANWGLELTAGVPVIVYCVHGHEVSRSAALRLRAMGVDAHFLSGGLERWRAEGGPVQAGETRPGPDSVEQAGSR